MNLLDSHDTDRVLTACGGDRTRYLQTLAFLLAYPGAPTIYYGNETGLEGDSAEDGRRCVPWDNLDDELHTFFKKAINYRKQSNALRLGDVETLIADDENRVYAFKRWLDDDVVYVLFNGSDEQVTVGIDETPAGTYYDALELHATIASKVAGLTIVLEPRGVAWYTHK